MRSGNNSEVRDNILRYVQCMLSSSMTLNVAVIGAGAAGLAAARRLRENPLFSYAVFEQNDGIGGTWVYDERVGEDEYGLPIHTSMYKSLRTNLPKEVMGFPDFPIAKPEEKSYIPADDMLRYLHDFADHYDLIPSIKFRHLVRKVVPNQNNGWTVTVKDLVGNNTVQYQFDAVMVCNGHYRLPNVPKLKGDESFQGMKLHSHDYRVPQVFQDRSVVVIGAGPSGLDIALEIAPFAEQVFLSHHLPDPIDTAFPENFTFKPDIDSVSKESVQFKDGTFARVDCIFYCTGYNYDFPFLAEECGVRNEDNYIHPLYKHLIAIENPTLCLVGLPFYVCANSMFDLQIRFFLSTLDGTFKLPFKEQMLEEEFQEMNKRREKGFTLRQSHMMGPLQMDYYDDLARTANIAGIPHVLTKLHNESSRRFLEDLVNYRNDKYFITDGENYSAIK